MKKAFILLLLIFIVTASYTPPPADLTTINIDGVNCGPHGNANANSKEFNSNVFKNRFDIPQSSDFDASIDIVKLAGAKENEQGFSNQKAVDIEGFVVAVKPGGKETCNCKTGNSLFKDTHIEIVANSNHKEKSDRVIIEVTPRLRQIKEEQGEDWSTENLKATIVNKFVHVQGWLFYDISHNKENFADDPDDNIGRDNWRATSWEIHPITSLEILTDEMAPVGSTDENENDNVDDGGASSPTQPMFKSMTSNKNSNTVNMNSNQTPTDMLVLIALGAILGMVGQGMRVIVGLKKMRDAAEASNVSTQQLYQASRVIMSLLIACAIGVIAGVLAAVSKLDATIDKSVLIAFIAAGYAGTDFIEGFIRKEGAAISQGQNASKNKGDSPV